MEQNRQDSNSQQQNVHLHMHQVVCGCHGNIYPTPTAYYPPVSYRTPAPPPMVTYTPHHQQIARPYHLQHYQYTQFNQYSVPVPQVASGTSQSVYQAGGATGLSADLVFGVRERRERLEVSDEGLGDGEKPEAAGGYDYGHVSPPPTKELLNVGSDGSVTENFVKFLERSCITAEQIAHRNRNRPCFRNIQNLCVRTRSEILKPCTTISNIHSQGVPWATKDFIYAFVRLTNCWHILRGYWENRDGTAIGKITKELTPEFRECYLRWEKETIDLAAQLTKVFYNLDTNINSPMSTGSVHAANNLIPPQVNLAKHDSAKKTEAAPPTSTSAHAPTSKSGRGVLHLPAVELETAEQGNQTCGDFYSAKAPLSVPATPIDSTDCLVIDNSEEEIDNNGRVYMKPGSYSVPKRTVANNTDPPGIHAGSPRTIEFLDTAQNVGKVMEAANRYWLQNKKEAALSKSKEEIINEPPQFNVQKWLTSSRFSDYDNASTRSSSPPNIVQYYIEQPVPMPFNDLHIAPELDVPVSSSSRSFTVLQRDKSTTISPKNRTVRGGKKQDKNKMAHKSTFEDKMGGLTDVAIDVLEKIVNELKVTDFAEYIVGLKNDNFGTNLEMILNKLRSRQYMYVNEVVRDLYLIVNYSSMYYANFIEMDAKIEVFVQKLQNLLEEHLSFFDFSSINGVKDEIVGPLKSKSCEKQNSL